MRGVPALVKSAVLLASLGALLGASAPAAADPAGDLAAAESALSGATSRLAAAESEVDRRRRTLKSVARRADRLERAANRAEGRVESVAAEVRDERLAAAEAIAETRAEHEDDVAQRNGLRTAGIVAIVIAALALLAIFVLRRTGKWKHGSAWIRVALGGAVLLLVAGLALVVLPSDPDEPRFSSQQLGLASDAEGDPLDPPTPELERARAVAAPDIAAARAAAADEARARATVRRAERAVSRAKTARARAERETDRARSVVARIEREADEEAAFREEATTIDYDQLIKDASDFKGEKVVYTGQVFQIQEFAGESIILLSVTDEGYGFWTDNIWVDYSGEIDSAEEDVITVYGKVTGSKEYETQIGGSTYVPRMTARYIDE